MPRNITVTFSDGSTHVYKGAPDDITPDAVAARAESDFGLEVASIDGGRGGKSSSSSTSAPGPSGRSAAPQARGPKETDQVIAKIVMELFPHAKIEGTKRTEERNREVGGVENSYHLTGHAVDVTGLSSDERARLKTELQNRGIALNDWLYHKVKGGLHLHIAAGHVPEEVYQQYGIGTPAPQVAAAGGIPGLPALPGQAPAGAPGGALPDLPDLPETAPPAEDNSSEPFSAGLAGLQDSGTFGFDDEIGGALGAAVGAIGGEGSFKDLYLRKRDNNRDRKKELEAKNPKSYLAGSVAGAFVPGVGALGAMGKAGKIGYETYQGASKIGKVAHATGQASMKGAALGAQGGAIYGLGSAEGDLLDHAGKALEYGATGAAGGALLGPAALGGAAVAGKVAPYIPGTVDNFVRKQIKNNPEAQRDAEIVSQDVVEGTGAYRSDLDPKNVREKVPARDLNSIERGFSARHRQRINGLNMPKADKDTLLEVLDKSRTLSSDKVDELLGPLADTVPGRAVKESAAKSRRLYLLTQPEPMTGKGKGAMMDAAITTGVAHIMPEAAALPLLRRLITRGGSGEAARANKAYKLSSGRSLKKYQALHEKLGPTEAKQSYDDLRDLYQSTVTRKESEAAAKKAAAAMKQQQKADEVARIKAEKAMYSKQNATISRKADFDNVTPTDGFRGLIYGRTGLKPIEQDQAILRMEVEDKVPPGTIQRFLANPKTLMDGNAGNKIVDRMEEWAKAGILKRDPEWKPAEAPAAAPQTAGAAPGPRVDAQGNPIRSEPAYQGGIQKNIAKEIEAERVAREAQAAPPQAAPQAAQEAPTPTAVVADEAAPPPVTRTIPGSEPVAVVKGPKLTGRMAELQAEEAAIDAERSARYYSDPAFQAAIDTGQDPYVGRLVEIIAERRAIRAQTPATSTTLKPAAKSKAKK